MKLYASFIAHAVIALCFSASLLSQASQTPTANLDATKIYEQASPAVVTITVLDEAGKKRLGSGVIVKPDGVIVTNYHVIKGAVSANVHLKNGDIYDEVGILETDERKDIAVIKIKATGLPAISFSDSNNVKVGQVIYALGSPIGLDGTFSSGMVSSIRPAKEVSNQLEGFRFIQFTAPVSHGSSGGPLLDEQGKIVGLVSNSFSGAQNLNLAIPANYVMPLASGVSSSHRSLSKMPQGKEKTVARTPAEILSSAKSICILVKQGNPLLKTEISSKLLVWGKLNLLSSPSEADLVLQVVQTSTLDGYGRGNEATALLSEPGSGVELWSTTKGGSFAFSGWRIASVARGIADEFIKMMEKRKKTSK